MKYHRYLHNVPLYNQELLKCISNTLRSPKIPKFKEIFQPVRLFYYARLLDRLEMHSRENYQNGSKDRHV